MKANQTNNSEPVYTGIVIEGLAGLKGGKKQHWINAHLKEISMLYDVLGPEQTRKALNMKPETLEKALQKSERSDRRNYTKADQAMNQAYLANEKLYKLRPEFDSVVEKLDRHIGDDQELRKVLSDFFQLQAAANNMMAKIVQNQNQDYVYFTEHISTADRREVSPTELITEQNSTKQINAGPTLVGRSFVSSNRETGKQHTSRSGKTHGTLRARYNAKKRDRRV